LINTGGTNLSGSATTSITGISGKQAVLVYLKNASMDTANSQVNLRINNDSGTNYTWNGVKQDAAANTTFPATTSYFAVSGNSSNIASVTNSTTIIMGTKATSGQMFIQNNGAGSASGGANQYGLSTNGFYTCSAAVTSIQIDATSGLFDAGQVFVYGMD
jgi:hypothetical protein